MKETDQIKEQMAVFSGKHGPKLIVSATVTAVNDDDTVAIKFSDDSTIDDARLKAVVKDGNKVLLIPKVGSIVLVGKIGNSAECVVLAVHEISDVQFLIGDYRFSMQDSGFKLTKGNSIEFSMQNAGFKISKGNETLKSVLQNIIEACQQILIIQGNNPDYVKLAQALVSLNIIFQ